MSTEKKHPNSHPGRVRRALAAVAKALALGGVFAVSAAGAVVLHMGMPAPRRFATARVNEILGSTFKGRIEIHRVGWLRLTTIGGVEASVFDPEGQRVAHAEGVRVRIGTWSLVRSLATGGQLDVRAPEIDVDGAEILIEDNAAGEIGLARAFESKEPSGPDTGPGTRVSLPEIHLRHAWVHGRLAAVPVIDADLKDLEAAVLSSPETLDLDVKRLAVHARGMPGMSPDGDVVASASLPSDEKADRKVVARYRGKVGDLPVVADASMNGNEVVAVLDVTDGSPAAIAAISGDKVTLGAPVTAHAEVHGTLPTLRPELKATLGPGSVHLTGSVTLPDADQGRPELTASAKVAVRDFDASLVTADAPPSRMSLDVDADVVSRPGGDISGKVHLESQVGEVKGQVVPAVSLVAEGGTKNGVKATAKVAERGLPAKVDLVIAPRPGKETLDQLTFDVDADVPDLNGIVRAGPIGRGSAHVAVSGRLDLESKQLSAKARAQFAKVEVSGVRLGRGELTAAAEGELTSPRFHAEVRGANLFAGGYAFPRVGVQANGTPETIGVAAQLAGNERSPWVRARARVGLGDVITVSGTHLHLMRKDVATSVDVASIAVANGVVDIRGVRATGLGEPLTASARIATGSLRVKAKGDDVDLSRVVTLLAQEEDTRGHLALDVDATVGRHGARGKVEARIEGLEARGVKDGKVRVAAAVDGTRLRGDVSASLGEIGKLDVNAKDVVLGGAPTDPVAWKRATGSLAINGAVDLAKLLEKVPIGDRPVERAAGKIAIEGKASRPTVSASPAVELQVQTTGLVVAGNRPRTKNPDGTIALGPYPFITEGLDGRVRLGLGVSSGDTTVVVDLYDKDGTLVKLDASSKLPIQRLLDDTAHAMALVQKTPVEAKITVPRRSLDKLPQAVGQVPVQGNVELVADVRGTVDAPTVKVVAKGTSLSPRDAPSSACARPMDMEAKLDYDGKKADVRVVASQGGAKVLDADAAVKVSAADLMAGNALSWDASGAVALTSFPLDKVGALVRQPIGGFVSGKASVADLHRAASADAELKLENLSLDKTTFPTGKIKVSMKDGKLGAAVRLDQVDGFADVSMNGALTWGENIAPALDLEKPVDVAIKAKAFRADAAAPFTQELFAEIDGRIDADAKLHVQPGGKDGQMDGAIAIRDGVIEVPQIGERFHGVKGRVIMKPWGTLRFEDFAAQAPTGKLTMTADAVMKGLALQKANAKIKIEKGQSIPIAVEGVPMGRAYGDITARATMSPDQKRLDLHLDIPVLHVDLPQSTGHSVQPLEPDKHVRVGVRAGREFVAIPLKEPEKPREDSSTNIRIAVKLGDDVVVRRDTTINIIATGAPVVEVSDKTRMRGGIRITRGRLELQGKQFTIDRGEVNFVGDEPSDPIVFATAFWDAPDGTRVFADFSGKVSAGKLALRSEPSLTQQEILSLILFGSTTGSFGSSPPPGREESTGVKAVGMAGGVVTEGVNKAISGITTADISTRVDTSDAASPRPELAVQISKKVSASVGYKLGVPAPGDNPDRTELTVDWRFVRNWSLTAVVGDQGSTALDLVWRYRY